MRVCVLVSDPPGNRLARMIETEEQALVEKFVAHAAVEALAESVLHRLPGAMKCQTIRLS
jgi:hypothetical protein